MLEASAVLCSVVWFCVLNHAIVKHLGNLSREIVVLFYVSNGSKRRIVYTLMHKNQHRLHVINTLDVNRS